RATMRRSRNGAPRARASLMRARYTGWTCVGLLMAATVAAGSCSRGGDPSAVEVSGSETTRPDAKVPADASRDDASRPAAPPGPPPRPDMVWVPGGTFRMGSDVPMVADARPVHEVEVDGFWMDATEVTNAQFARFVNDTGYRTLAERTPLPADNPGVPPELLVPGSIVFAPPGTAVPLDNPLRWWRFVPGASWRAPEGPGSSIQGRDDYPVVHIAFE